MDYRTFVENMKEQVQANLGQDYEVQIITNPKLNGTEKTGQDLGAGAGGVRAPLRRHR